MTTAVQSFYLGVRWNLMYSYSGGFSLFDQIFLLYSCIYLIYTYLFDIKNNKKIFL